MNKETTWVKNSSANVNREDTNDDIIVTTVEGYIYQIYYDEVTEQKFIEYVGKENKGVLPNLKTSYNKEKATLSAEVTNTSDVEVDKIELIYRGEVLETKNDAKVTFSNLQYTGWYMVRVTAVSGQMRYAWIRVSSTVIAPKIEIISEGKPVNGWFGADQKPLIVKISTDNPTAKGITYFIAGAISKDNTRVEGKEVTLEKELQKDVGITVSGTITITAWVDDGEGGNESETATVDINYDNIKPTLAETITPEKSGTWYNSQEVKISLANSTDENSKVARYKYKYIEKDETDTEKEFNTEYKEVTDYAKTPIIITKDGIRKIEIVVVDNAGNESAPKQIEIYKDGTAPKFINDEVKITERTTNSFKITAIAEDDLSGNPNRNQDYKITYKYTVKPVGGQPIELPNSTTTNNTYDVTGLDPKKDYQVTVEASDRAGNRATKTDVQASTKGILQEPKITLTSNTAPVGGEEGWYRDTINVKIKDETPASQSGANRIVYEIDGQQQTFNLGDTREVNTTINKGTKQGTRTITAWLESEDENGKSTSSKKEPKLDTIAPAVPKLEEKNGTKKIENGEWYTNNVDVVITAGTDQGSEAGTGSGSKQIKYKVNGTEQEIVNATTKTHAIDQDGTYTITAQTVDLAGNISEESGAKIIKRDTTAPSKAELTVGTQDYHTIKVTAKGEDATSKVASYEFQKSTVNDDTKFTTVATKKASELDDIGTCDYTYEGLDTSTTYYFRVIVTDNAGNKTTSEVQRGTTKGDLQAPNIELTSDNKTDQMQATEDGTWRHGNITITIKDSADSTKTSATKIKYQITKGTEIVKAETKEGTSITLDTKITEDGTYKIEAWVIGRTEKNISTSSTRNVKRDTTKPGVPTLKVSKGTETIAKSGWYTSTEVEATITAGEDVKNEGVNEVSGKAKIRYTVNGAAQSDVTAATATYKLPTDGKFEIVAYTVDNAGNVSEPSQTFTIKRDTTKPNKPSIGTKTGDIGQNGWYTSNIGIPITAGDDITPEGINEVSGKSKVKYTINGGAETTAEGLQATASITNDGASYEVKAYTIDNAGNVSEAETVTGLKKDGTVPKTATLVKNTEWYTTIDVTATGADDMSGVASYTFYYSTSKDGDYGTGTKVDSNEKTPGTQAYQYKNLQTGTTYWLKVKVTDKAGKEKMSEAIQAQTKGDLLKPTIKVTSTLDTDPVTDQAKWNKGTLTVTITDSGETGKSSVTEIHYTINDANETTVKGTTATVPVISKDGSYKITAWVEGRNGSGKTSNSAEWTVLRDTTKPTKPSIAVASSSGQGINDWYKQNVSLTITAGSDPKASGVNAVSEVAKVQYKIDEGKLTDGASPTANLTNAITADGKHTVVAYTVDNAGNVSEPSETLTIKKDTVKPAVPTIKINNNTATDVTNGWYTKDISLTITAGKDQNTSNANEISNEQRIRYTINGGDSKYIESTSGPVTINTDGTNFDVIAYTIDTAGNESDASAKTTVKRDATVPSTATITVSTKDITYNAIKVTATGTDATSKVASYTFYKSETNADEGWSKVETKEASKTNLEQLDYTYEGLKTGTTYWFKVEVTDNAGNKKTSNVDKGTTLGDLKAPNITLASTEQADNIAGTGDGTWRKGNITITIEDSADSTKTSATQIKYQITKGTEQITSGTKDGTKITLDTKITADGTYTIQAWALGRGGTSPVSERTVKRDATLPEKPSASVTTPNTKPTTGWYTTESVIVTLTVKQESAEQSGIDKIKYTLNKETEQEIAGTSGTVTISTNGTNTISAYTLDKAGNRCNGNYTFTVQKDSEKPTAKLEVQEKGVGKDTIKVTATGSDTVSGVAKYSFQKSETSATANDFQEVHSEETNAGTVEYTYTGLTPGKTYYLKVVVTDVAGNVKESTVITQSTIKPDPKVGDYVAYQKWINDWDEANSTGGRTYNADAPETDAEGVEQDINYYSGVKDAKDAGVEITENTAHTTEKLDWQILYKEGDELILIPDTHTTQSLTLYGKMGYTNGETLLDQLCEECYSSLELGTKAMNIDVGAILKINGKDQSGINKEERSLYLSPDSGIQDGYWSSPYCSDPDYSRVHHPLLIQARP